MHLDSQIALFALLCLCGATACFMAILEMIIGMIEKDKDIFKDIESSREFICNLSAAKIKKDQSDL